MAISMKDNVVHYQQREVPIMFLGHYGLALASKRVAPESSLGTLTFAANFADCLWPVLLLLGLETVEVVPGLMAASPMKFVAYPWSHSLVTQIALGVLFGLAVFIHRRSLKDAL